MCRPKVVPQSRNRVILEVVAAGGLGLGRDREAGVRRDVRQGRSAHVLASATCHIHRDLPVPGLSRYSLSKYRFQGGGKRGRRQRSAQPRYGGTLGGLAWCLLTASYHRANAGPIGVEPAAIIAIPVELDPFYSAEINTPFGAQSILI
jgi:hypothetical protein